MATTPNRSWPTPDDTDLVRDGAAAIRALGDAIDGSVGQGFVYAGTRYYTSSGQFEKADPLGTGDIGLRAIKVRMVGGGGNGGAFSDPSVSSRGLGGGGGGGYAEAFITDIAGLSASETVTRGAGPGGTSSFGTLVVATGGSNGGTGGGLGGIGTAGDILIKGNDGDAGGWVSLNFSGSGGSSQLGGGAQGIIPFAASSAGSPGGLFGGGGGGARGQTGTAAAGGAGANGIVIVECFV